MESSWQTANSSLDYQFDLWEDSLCTDILHWILFAVTALGNVLVIATFVRDRELRAKVPNLYILNLSVADLLVGAVFILVFSNLEYVVVFGETACKFMISVALSTCSLSVWAVVLISYDRYILITKGLEYGSIQTYRKFLVTCSIVWIVSYARYVGLFLGYDLVVATSKTYSSGYCSHEILEKSSFLVYDVITSYVIPVILIAYFNARLYGDIRKRSRGLPRNWASVEPEGNPSDRSEVTAANPPVRRDGSNDFRKHRRAAITLGFIVGVASLCWIPYYTVVFMYVIGARESISNTMYTVTQYIYYGNSAINPLLYVATNPRIRNGMVKMILCKR